MPNASPARGLAAVVLAAGRSERMGAPKPLLDWGGRPLVAHQVATLAAVAPIDEIVVVTGRASDDVARALAATPARLVSNPDYARGRATSVVVGVRALESDPAGILIASVDQPLTPRLVASLVAAWREAPRSIARPTHGNASGHPLIFPAALRAELESVSDSTSGLRAVVHKEVARVLDVELPYPETLLNLNTRDAYEHARRLSLPDPS